MNFTSRHDALNLTAAAAVYDVLGLPADELARGARVGEVLALAR